MSAIDLQSWTAPDGYLPLVRQLSGIIAPSGHEWQFRDALIARFAARGWDVHRDRLGQLAVSFGPESKPSVLITAHLDEIGLVIRNISADGYLRVSRVGGVPERVLPAARVIFMGRDGPVAGHVGVIAHHLTPDHEKYVAHPIDDLYVDMGFGSSADAVDAGLSVGDMGTYAPTWSDMPGGRFAGKALDDRVGVAVLIAVADALAADPPPVRVHVGFTTQEEFAVRGTLALAHKFQPDVLIAVDIAPATDTPDLAQHTPVQLGGGVVLERMSFHGRGTLTGLIPHPALVDLARDAAADNRIPLQLEAIVGLVTDATYAPTSTSAGIAAVDLGIPCRYTHSPVETCAQSDLSAAERLIEDMIRRVGQLPELTQ